MEKKSNESAKYKGKKEKRLQRATFREIYQSLEVRKSNSFFLLIRAFFFQDGTSPELEIKFGRETLELTSWTNRFYYNTFSGLLASGMNVHLKVSDHERLGKENSGGFF